MKILLLAPHPFYQERGTPIAVDLLLRVWSERGDQVDVLTYHEGVDRSYPGVTIHRIAPPPLCRNIRPGFSLKKVGCDLYLLRMALCLARRERYDIVHAVEESAFVAMLLRRRMGTPYVFDMDSSMPRQIVDKMPLLKFALPLMTRLEARAVRKARAVVVMCDSLAELAQSYGATDVVVLRDISLLPFQSETAGVELKKELGIKGLCFLYLGNLEQYQGIALLLRSFALLLKRGGSADLVIAGGAADDIRSYQGVAVELGVAERVHFVGPKPLGVMAALFRGADVLVSPRTHGANTPMKIYSYLDSGKPIVATRLATHTQVLDETTAELAEPDPESFANGMARLAGDAALRERLGCAARELCRAKYSFAVYRATLCAIYARLGNQAGF
jgi:glycosyltransferase involved in cell wall biosynthesis